MDIEQSNKKAMREKTSRFGRCMAKTHKIINAVMVVDAKAQPVSLWGCSPESRKVCAH
jgi:hypothetical protein